jgi:hypothetical protein
MKYQKKMNVNMINSPAGIGKKNGIYLNIFKLIESMF